MSFVMLKRTRFDFVSRYLFKNREVRDAPPPKPAAPEIQLALVDVSVVVAHIAANSSFLSMLLVEERH